MGNLLFSPSGRIGPNEFMKGAIILIIVAIVIAIPNLLGMPDVVVNILSILSFVTLWCWVVLWVKRYHDGGKSGWTCLLPIMIYLVIFLIIMAVLLGSGFMEVFEATTNGASEDELAEMERALTQKTALPIMIASSVLSFAIAFLFNKTIKQDMHDNQYGPHGSVGNTFS